MSVRARMLEIAGIARRAVCAEGGPACRGRLRHDPAQIDPLHPHPRLLERARLAAAALARRGADPARDRGRRHRYRRVPDADGSRPGYRSGAAVAAAGHRRRSEEHTSELQSLMRSSYAVFCLKKKNTMIDITNITSIST